MFKSAKDVISFIQEKIIKSLYKFEEEKYLVMEDNVFFVWFILNLYFLKNAHFKIIFL